MYANNTNENCSFRQPMFSCELHYRNIQPHLNLEISNQNCKVRMPLYYTPYSHLQDRNQARPLEYKIISYIYNTDYLSVLY